VPRGFGRTTYTPSKASIPHWCGTLPSVPERACVRTKVENLGAEFPLRLFVCDTKSATAAVGCGDPHNSPVLWSEGGISRRVCGIDSARSTMGVHCSVRPSAQRKRFAFNSFECGISGRTAERRVKTGRLQRRDSSRCTSEWWLLQLANAASHCAPAAAEATTSIQLANKNILIPQVVWHPDYPFGIDQTRATSCYRPVSRSLSHGQFQRGSDCRVSGGVCLV
jgi:hypothetical protein